MKILNNLLIQKTPDIIELRAYLAQFIGYNDKRDFIQLSFDIENYINKNLTSEIDIFDFILNDIELEKINEVLKEFDILPEKIYFFITDRDSYTELYFENFSLNILNLDKLSNSGNNEDDFCESDFCEEDFMDNRFVPTDIPNLYNKIHQISLENDLIVMEKIPSHCYEIYDTDGNNISYLFMDIIDYLNSSESFYFESHRFSSVNLGENNTILIELGGRIENWVLFEKHNGEIKAKEFSNINPYSLPKDFKYLDSSEVIQKYIK